MPEYIEKEKLFKRSQVINLQTAIGSIKAVSLDYIASIPAADVAPVVHGRWIPVPSSDMNTGPAYKCSNCQKMRYGRFLPPYCSMCGAKMDLEVHHERT